MDLSFLNKVSFLKNVDFTDETNQKKALVIVVGFVVLVGLLIFLYYPENNDNQVASNEIENSTIAPALDIQNGEDYDNLERTDNRTIYRSGDGQSLAELLFTKKDTTQRDNPLGDIIPDKPTSEDDSKEIVPERSSSSTGESSTRQTIRPGQQGVFPRRELPSAFNVSKEDLIKSMEGSDETKDNEREDKEKELKKRENALRERQKLIEMGINPDTNLPFEYGGAPASSNVQSEPTPEVAPPPQVAAVNPEIIVNEEGLDDDDSFGLGTTKISSMSSVNKNELEKLTIKVMFIEEKKVKSGDRVQLRLCEKKGITVQGEHIPNGSLLYATVSLGERLFIFVQSINVNGRILPLNLEAYDVDGLRGIYCPTNETEQVLKEVGREAKEIVTGTIGGLMRSFGARFVSTGNSVTDRLTGQTSVYITAGYSFDLMKAQ